MNTAEYKEKMEVLVRDENTYTNLNKDLSLFTNDTITIIDKQLYNDVGLYKECFGNYQSKVLGAVPNIISEANRWSEDFHQETIFHNMEEQSNITRQATNTIQQRQL